MKSRIQNRTRIPVAGEEEKEYNQPSPINEEQVQENRIPRPIYPSINFIPKHDKFAAKNNGYSFPPADSQFTCDNIHDAGPNFIRVTSGFLGNTPGRWNFPNGVWIMPFGSDNVPKLTIKTPFRCQRCKAYANPYFKIEATNVFCNICSHRFAPEKIDPIILNSAELYTYGVIDFKVSDPLYFKKETQKVKIVLAIQFTKNTIDTTIFHSIIESVKSCIQSATFESAVRISVVTFNTGTTFYKIRNVTDQPIEYVVSDPIDSLCPLSQKQLYYNPNVDQEKEKLLYLLDWIYAKAQDYKNINPTTNYFSTLQCLSTSFGNNAGRIVLFSLVDPTIPPGKIRPRQKEEIKTPLRSIHDEYKQLAKKLAKNKIGVDHFVFGKEGVYHHQLATTHWLSSSTGGTLYHYFLYNPQINSQHLYYSIYKNLTREMVYDVDFTCRVSNGLTVSNYSIFDGVHQERDIGLGIFDNQGSIFVNIQQEQKLVDVAYLQFAIMFTNGNGERIIRVINYRYHVIDKLEMIHSGSDYLAVSNYIMRKFSNELLRSEPSKVLQDAFNFIVTLFAQYRQQKGDIKYSQLQIHPNLKNLLVYFHAFITTILFTHLTKNLADIRIVEISKINSISFQNFANRYYPKLYSVDLDIYNADILPGDYIEGTDIAIIPSNLPLTASSLKQDSAYLVNDSEYLYLFVMPKAPEDLLMELFQVSSINQIQGRQLPQLDTGHNIRVTNIIGEIRRRNQGLFLPLLVITANENNFFNQRLNSILREDKMQRQYLTFLKQLHTRIQSGK